MRTAAPPRGPQTHNDHPIQDAFHIGEADHSQDSRQCWRRDLGGWNLGHPGVQDYGLLLGTHGLVEAFY